MPLLRSGTSNKIATFNKHGLYLRWPRAWIIIIGIMLIFLCFCIAGMEIGNTLFDQYRATAFGGFIVFPPLLICAILILITACKPRLTLLRIAIIFCFLMMILCLVLIAYDIVVLVDPTRCLFLNCNYATVNVSNSTFSYTVTGWPIYISWPSYFQTNMNAKRIFQSIQILLAVLFILFCSLYISTYFIYRRINLDQKSPYSTFGTPITPTRREFSKERSSHSIQLSQQPYSLTHPVTTYIIEGHLSASTKDSSAGLIIKETSPRKIKKKSVVRPRASSVNYDRVCTRCMKEPRMVLTSNYERQNYFSHLCVNCNNELLSYRRKPAYTSTLNSRLWKP